MRVIHWYPNFLGGGGAANSVLALANAQAIAGTDVWITSVAHEHPLYGPTATKNGVRVSVWSGRGLLGRGGVRLHLVGRATARVLQAIEPDVVHVHGEFNPDNWWPPRLFRCPLVLTPYGAFHPAVRQRGALRKSLYIAVARRALYRSTTSFNALSPAETADIGAVLPAARTYCVPSGASPAVADGIGTLARDSGDSRERVRLMFVGRIDVTVKGLDTLLEAFALATRDLGLSQPATLSLVGPDWRDGKSHLRNLARRLGVQDLIEIRDPVTSADVPALIQSCDAYVQLSRNDAFPLSLADALVLGKPAIVSDRVGTVSYDEVRQQPHVKVVPPTVSSAAEAIVWAVANLDALTRAASQARPALQDFFSWDRIARLHLQEYESLIAEAVGGAR
jgi:glycosyltransferase involved in cell wall biosynthesis